MTAPQNSYRTAFYQAVEVFDDADDAYRAGVLRLASDSDNSQLMIEVAQLLKTARAAFDALYNIGEIWASYMPRGWHTGMDTGCNIRDYSGTVTRSA